MPTFDLTVAYLGVDLNELTRSADRIVSSVFAREGLANAAEIDDVVQECLLHKRLAAMAKYEPIWRAHVHRRAKWRAQDVHGARKRERPTDPSGFSDDAARPVMPSPKTRKEIQAGSREPWMIARCRDAVAKRFLGPTRCVTLVPGQVAGAIHLEDEATCWHLKPVFEMAGAKVRIDKRPADVGVSILLGSSAVQPYAARLWSNANAPYRIEAANGLSSKIYRGQEEVNATCKRLVLAGKPVKQAPSTIAGWLAGDYCLLSFARLSASSCILSSAGEHGKATAFLTKLLFTFPLLDYLLKRADRASATSWQFVIPLTVTHRHIDNLTDADFHGKPKDCKFYPLDQSPGNYRLTSHE